MADAILDGMTVALQKQRLNTLTARLFPRQPAATAAPVRRVCAWCQTPIGLFPRVAGSGGTTHGMCVACSRKLLARATVMPGTVPDPGC